MAGGIPNRVEYRKRVATKRVRGHTALPCGAANGEDYTQVRFDLYRPARTRNATRLTTRPGRIPLAMTIPLARGSFPPHPTPPQKAGEPLTLTRYGIARLAQRRSRSGLSPRSFENGVRGGETRLCCQRKREVHRTANSYPWLTSRLHDAGNRMAGGGRYCWSIGSYIPVR